MDGSLGFLHQSAVRRASVVLSKSNRLTKLMGFRRLVLEFPLPFTRFAAGWPSDLRPLLNTSNRCLRQVLHSHQIVTNCRERPFETRRAFVSGLLQSSYCLHPAKDFFYSLTSSLAYLVSNVTGCRTLVRVAFLMRNVWRHVHFSQRLDKLSDECRIWQALNLSPARSIQGILRLNAKRNAGQVYI